MASEKARAQNPLGTRVGLAVGLAMCLLLSACGSTVREAAFQQPGSTSDAAVAVGGEFGSPNALASRSGGAGAASGARSGQPATGGASASGPVGTTSPGGTSGSAGAPGAGGASGSAAPGGDAGPAGPGGGSPTQPARGGAATGRGFDETTVNIGYTRVDDAGPFADSLGVDAGATTIDAAAVLQAIVDDINASGGLAGRQINLVPHDANAADLLLNPDAYSQAACATWTEDNQVFAVIGSIAYEALLACLGDNDTPLIATGGIDIPRFRYQYFYDRYPLYLNVGGFVGEAYDRVAYRRLLDRGFFEPWDSTTGAPATGPTAPPVKFGLIIEETEEGRAGAEHIAQVLADLGIELTRVQFIPQGTGTSAQLANAALQFRSEGITHATSFAASFLTAAESQGYYPRMFIEQSLNFYALSYSARSLNGAMGQSFLPALDSSGDAYPGFPNPAAYEPCLAAAQAAGQQPSSVLDHHQVQSACDAFHPMRDALAAGGELSNDALLTGFAALGDRPVSSVTWTSRFDGTRRASAAAVRDISYVADCTCWRYDSAVNHPAG